MIRHFFPRRIFSTSAITIGYGVVDRVYNNNYRRFAFLSILCAGCCSYSQRLAAENAVLKLGEASAWKGDSGCATGEYTPFKGEKRMKTIDFNAPGSWTRGCQEFFPTTMSAQRIFLRFSSNASTRVVLAFKGPGGGFSSSFDVLRGEHVKIIPVDVFSQKGDAASWSAIKTVSLSITGKAKFNLISITISSDKNGMPLNENIRLLSPFSAINHIATLTPLYAIVDLEKYPKRYQTGERRVNQLLYLLFNKKLPVESSESLVSDDWSNKIIIGRKGALAAGAATRSELKKMGFNGFVVNSKMGSLTIAGESIQGTTYGIYKYFERNGLKFFAPGVYTKRKTPSRCLVAYDFKDKPFFKGKRITGAACIYGDSSIGFSMGDPRTAGIDAKYPCDKTLWIDHTAAFLVPKKLYLKDHPEYFTLRGDGKRLPPDTPDMRLMLCQSSQGGIKVAAERAIKWIEAQKERKYFIIQQGDDMDACCCETCKKRRAEGWNESDLMLYWINSIASKVYEKFPDKYLICYAYVSTQPAPNKLKLAKNVQLLYAPWPTKLSAPNGFRDFDAPENIIARKQINDWIEKCGAENLGIYDYNSYGAMTLRGMANRVKWLARHGMKGGFWYCGTPRIFSKLFKYVHSQLNWDPLQNTMTLEKEFIRAYYGKAAPVMEKIVESIYDKLDENDENNSRKPAPSFFSKNFTDKVLAWFDEAEKLAPKKIKKEIAVDRYNFCLNGIYALNPVSNLETSKEQSEVFGVFLGKYIKYEVEKYKMSVNKARKRGKSVPSVNSLCDKIWNLTHVKIETAGLKDGEIPPRLDEMEKAPLATINKFQIREFTKTLPDGSILIPAMAFSGGVGPMYYKWKCEGKTAAWVRGSMTEVSTMMASFNVDGDTSGEFILEMEGQDSDKLWCPPAPIKIFVNDKIIFNGPNGFKKHGWSKRTFKIPSGIIKRGANQVRIKNIAHSDSRSAHWFMISELKVSRVVPESK